MSAFITFTSLSKNRPRVYGVQGQESTGKGRLARVDWYRARLGSVTACVRSAVQHLRRCPNNKHGLWSPRAAGPFPGLLRPAESLE